MACAKRAFERVRWHTLALACAVASECGVKSMHVLLRAFAELLGRTTGPELWLGRVADHIDCHIAYKQYAGPPKIKGKVRSYQEE